MENKVARVEFPLLYINIYIFNSSHVMSSFYRLLPSSRLFIILHQSYFVTCPLFEQTFLQFNLLYRFLLSY